MAKKKASRKVAKRKASKPPTHTRHRGSSPLGEGCDCATIMPDPNICAGYGVPVQLE